MRRVGLARPLLASALLLRTALTPATAMAEAMAVPAERQVTIIFKVLTYDRQLEARAGAELVVGIVHDPTDKDSATAADEIQTTLFKFAGKTVRSLPIKYFLIEYSKPADAEAFIKAKNINMLYVTPGLSKNLPEILKIAQTHHIPTVTGVPEYVRRGVSLGIGLRQDQPQILINLASSRAEGIEFDASLLRIATIVQ